MRQAVESCEKHKCKAVDRRILLTGIVVRWFCAGVNGYDPFWVGGEDEKTSSLL